MSARGPAGNGDRERRRVGLLVASIPVALFALSVAFVALRSPPRPDACRHDHPTAQVRAWWEKARENDVSVPGTRYVELREPRDGGPACIRVGLEDPQARAHLERRFRRLQVPGEVVVYEDAGSDASSAPATGGRP